MDPVLGYRDQTLHSLGNCFAFNQRETALDEFPNVETNKLSYQNFPSQMERLKDFFDITEVSENFGSVDDLRLMIKDGMRHTISGS